MGGRRGGWEDEGDRVRAWGVGRKKRGEKGDWGREGGKGEGEKGEGEGVTFYFLKYMCGEVFWGGGGEWGRGVILGVGRFWG